MAFRNPASALVQVGLAPGRQVIIDPADDGQITFPNPNGFGPAQIGTNTNAGFEQLQIDGPVAPGTTDYSRLLFSDFAGGSPNLSMAIFKPSTAEQSAVNLSPSGLSLTDRNSDVSGHPVIVRNTTQFGAGVNLRWAAQITYHPSTVVTAGVNFNVSLPISWPVGDAGAWAWVSLLGNPGVNINFVTPFPGGVRSQIQLVCTNTGTFTFCMITIVQYP